MAFPLWVVKEITSSCCFLNNQRHETFRTTRVTVGRAPSSVRPICRTPVGKKHRCRNTKKHHGDYMSEEHQEYPQDVSKDEAFQKFQLLLIDGMGGLTSSQTFPVVARILSSSDVLVKTNNFRGQVVYSHRRWGRTKTTATTEPCRWFPMNTSIVDFKQLIADFSFGNAEEMFPGSIVGSPFVYKPA